MWWRAELSPARLVTSAYDCDAVKRRPGGARVARKGTRAAYEQLMAVRRARDSHRATGTRLRRELGTPARPSSHAARARHARRPLRRDACRVLGEIRGGADWVRVWVSSEASPPVAAPPDVRASRGLLRGHRAPRRARAQRNQAAACVSGHPRRRTFRVRRSGLDSDRAPAGAREPKPGLPQLARTADDRNTSLATARPPALFAVWRGKRNGGAVARPPPAAVDQSRLVSARTRFHGRGRRDARAVRTAGVDVARSLACCACSTGSQTASTRRSSRAWGWRRGGLAARRPFRR